MEVLIILALFSPIVFAAAYFVRNNNGRKRRFAELGERFGLKVDLERKTGPIKAFPRAMGQVGDRKVDVVSAYRGRSNSRYAATEVRTVIRQPVPPTRILPRGLIVPQALYKRVETGDEAFERKVFVDSKDETVLDWFDAGLRQQLVEHAKYGRKVMEFSIEGRNVTYVAYGLLDSDKRLEQVTDAVGLVCSLADALEGTSSAVR